LFLRIFPAHTGYLPHNVPLNQWGMRPCASQPANTVPKNITSMIRIMVGPRQAVEIAGPQHWDGVGRN
jgi:hypothetical protein